MRLVRGAAIAGVLILLLAGPVLGGTLIADLSVVKTDSPDPVAAGSNITYTITVQNAPTAFAAVETSVSDTIPAGTTFVSLTAPAGWTPTTPPVGGTGAVTITHPSVIAGSSHVFTLIVQVGAAVPVGTVISNSATATTIAMESNLQNNSATATTTVAAPAPTPAASLSDAAMPEPTTGNPLVILGFTALLVAALGATAVLATRRVRP